MNRILHFMCISNSKISKYCFESLLYSLFRVHFATFENTWENQDTYNPILNSYINFHVKIDTQNRPLHEEIIRNWIKILKGEGSETIVENGSEV